MQSELPAAALTAEADLAGKYARPYVVTLCRLSRPVSIRPPRSPQLAAFTFFISRLRRQDGSERLYLHMGYFDTLSEAQQWSQRMRTRYPHAIATPAPPIELPRPGAEPCALGSAVPPAATAAPGVPAAQDPPPPTDAVLSDTQVMRLLETGSLETTRGDTGPTDAHIGAPVELLRPDDTQTRRSLKESVVAGLPVPFAVQLQWSLQPIDAARVPLLDVFSGYTLYRTETRRAGRTCYFLRLGFFTDPLSAREVACQVRSSFASAAVVPVTELEFLHAGEARIDVAAPAGPLHQGTDELPLAPASKASAGSSRQTLDDTLEVLAQRNLWIQHDTLSDTGVRHLKVTIKGRRDRPARRQKAPTRLA